MVTVHKLLPSRTQFVVKVFFFFFLVTVSFWCIVPSAVQVA